MRENDRPEPHILGFCTTVYVERTDQNDERQQAETAVAVWVNEEQIQ